METKHKEKLHFYLLKVGFRCNQGDINPIQPTSNQFINHLSKFGENNYSYNITNAYEAAITQTLLVNGTFSFNQKPLLIRFMKGVFLEK